MVVRCMSQGVIQWLLNACHKVSFNGCEMDGIRVMQVVLGL